MADPWLVAGLGNPGEQYAASRHNAGAMVIERLAERLGARLRKVRFLPVMAGEALDRRHPVLLVRTTSFMNQSGPPVASFARKRGIPVGHVIVCHDEIDLPLGALRIKRGGSTAGHHGLDSLVEAFRSADFYRVRIGVGKPSRREAHVRHVLGPFSKREREEFDIVVEVSADAVLSLVEQGLEATQSTFNRSGPKASS
jgi:peptidyl-tRNA hydrolase, PTH1 family